MKKLTKEVEKEIQEFIENNQPKVHWDYQSVSQSTIKEILVKGINEYIDDLYENNLEYMWDIERYLIDEIQKQWDDYDPDEIEEFSREFICVDLDIDGLINQLPDITCLAYVYSNYDCCNSFDEFIDGEYLKEVWKRVKAGVKKDDYMHEFYNGAYGGCLFCFAFKTDIKTVLELKDKMKTGKEIFIPKGTQFGFFSSFQGAGTVFEKTTYQDIILPLVGETEYDSIDIMPDLMQSYSMADVYGDSSFIDENDVEIR